MKHTFASKTFASKTFAAGALVGVGVDGGTPADPGTSVPYPLSQRATISFPSTTYLNAQSVEWVQAGRIRDITGETSGSTADKSRIFRRGRLPVGDIVVRGDVRPAALAQRCSLTFGAIKIAAARWRLRKSWSLIEVTGETSGGTADTIPRWTWADPTYSLQFEGYPNTTTGPVLATELDAVTLDINGVGTLSFAESLYLDHSREILPIAPGGGRPYATFSGRYSGAVTYTVGSNSANLTWLFSDPSDMDDPLRGSISVATNAETLAATAIVYDVSLFVDYTRGGKIAFEALCRVDAP